MSFEKCQDLIFGLNFVIRVFIIKRYVSKVTSTRVHEWKENGLYFMGNLCLWVRRLKEEAYRWTRKIGNPFGR